MDPVVLAKGHGFATYPSVFLKGDKKDSKGKIKFSNLKQLIFGDYIRLELENGQPVTRVEKGVAYVKVRARDKSGYVQAEQIMPDRVLEVNFVDIGQGDGCHLVTPDDEHYLIDAGQSDNMYRFLKWRFNLKKAGTKPPPFTVIVSHSDLDHYKGFDKIFSLSADTRQQFTISKVYHNGMVELSGSKTDSLGTKIKHEGKEYITDLCDTPADFTARAALPGAGTYIKTLLKTNAPKQSLRVAPDPYLYRKGPLSMEVIGPVAQKINGKDALPVFDDNKGKTKNGHSVMIRLSMGKFRVFLGGDLNTPAEQYLLKHYSAADVAAVEKELQEPDIAPGRKKQLTTRLDAAIEKAREKLQCELAKACHHGAADFTTSFLRALNPLATVISSGDDEPHCHPRPDTLGTIGKHSRGERSLIYSTELSRSGREFIDISKLKPGTTRERVVTVYGMINLRTDGRRVIIAQKLERKAARGDWDIQEIRWNEAKGEFVYEAKQY